MFTKVYKKALQSAGLFTFNHFKTKTYKLYRSNYFFTTLTTCSTTDEVTTSQLMHCSTNFAGVIYPNQKYTLSAVADGTLGAGALKTLSIVGG